MGHEIYLTCEKDWWKKVKAQLVLESSFCQRCVHPQTCTPDPGILPSSASFPCERVSEIKCIKETCTPGLLLRSMLHWSCGIPATMYSLPSNLLCIVRSVVPRWNDNLLEARLQAQHCIMLYNDATCRLRMHNWSCEGTCCTAAAQVSAC